MATGVNLQVTSFPPRAKAITPHDTDFLTDHAGNATAQQVYVTAEGDVQVLPAGNADGQTVTFTIADGGYIPVLCSKVLSTGTTATGLVGIF